MDGALIAWTARTAAVSRDTEADVDAQSTTSPKANNMYVFGAGMASRYPAILPVLAAQDAWAFRILGRRAGWCLASESFFTPPAFRSSSMTVDTDRPASFSTFRPISDARLV